MIQSFKIVNHLNESLYLDIRKPEDTGFLVASVTGLGYPKVDFSEQKYSNYDGSYYGEQHIGPRNIVMNIVFYGNNKDGLDIESLRWKLNRFLIVKTELKFYVTNEHGSFWIKGFLESNDPNIFSSQEAVQISILCPDPFFISEEDSKTVTIGLSNPLFEFPIEFKSETNGIEFGQVKSYPSTEIDYKGSAVSGVQIVIEAKDEITGFRIDNASRNEYITIDETKLKPEIGHIKKYDQIIINTDRGKKSAVLIRDGVSYNILNICSSIKNWINLQTGPNIISYSTTSDVNMVDIKVEYLTRYLGV